MKKINRTTLFLFVYLLGISAYVFPSYKESGEWIEFFLIIVGSSAVFLLLRYVLVLQNRNREKRRNEQS